MKELHRTTRSWVFGGQRRVRIRQVYPKRNVISLAGWRLARAAHRIEAAKNELAYLETQLRASEVDRQELIDDVADAVIDEIRRQAQEIVRKRKRKKKRKKPRKTKS